ncbi:tyrosine aminotransferase [Blastocladiella britannica]|nr:tyrosine aminotransferase [Blastocladiella britannica]
MTTTAKRTTNPIRAIVDNMKVAPNPAKPVISLALGDPTVFGNFNIDPSCSVAITRHLLSGKANGYPPAHGSEPARAAIARAYTTTVAPLTAGDVIIASGCSGAIDLAISAMAEPGQTILVPRPGFPLYETLASSKGINFKYYNLDPTRNWDIDLDHLEAQIDASTAFILVNNPSNPCGSVFSPAHLKAILALAEKHYLPIVADEIYAGMTFPRSEHAFTPLASLPSPVPIVAVGGLAKRWLVPGWRVGWALVHDKGQGALTDVRTALLKLSQLIIGANSVVQAAIPEILESTPQTFFDATNAALQRHAEVAESVLGRVPGLHVVVPQGAMYVMVGITPAMFNGIADDVQFTEKLMAEESVMTLPGACFQCPNFFRIVTCPALDKLQEACERIAEFCERHRKQ